MPNIHHSDWLAHAARLLTLHLGQPVTLAGWEELERERREERALADWRRWNELCAKAARKHK